MKNRIGWTSWIGLVLGLIAGLGVVLATEVPQGDLYQISLKSIDGESVTLKPYQNQVLLLVNTASRCGYTSQYKGLQALYDRYRAQGLVVLGFPSNDFGWQEPGSNRQIKLFCKSNYQVSFPMFDKAPVRGGDAQELYQWLIKNSEDHSAVRWNFEKYLVGRDGKIRKHFRSSTSPESDEMTQAIEAALKEPVPAPLGERSKKSAVRRIQK